MDRREPRVPRERPAADLADGDTDVRIADAAYSGSVVRLRRPDAGSLPRGTVCVDQAQLPGLPLPPRANPFGFGMAICRGGALGRPLLRVALQSEVTRER